MRTVPWSEGVESRLWRWEEGVGQEDMEMVGVDNSFRTFGCGGLNTDEAAGTGCRTVEGGGFVVFKDGSHLVKPSWSLFSYLSDAVFPSTLNYSRAGISILFTVVYCCAFLWCLTHLLNKLSLIQRALRP